MDQRGLQFATSSKCIVGQHSLVGIRWDKPHGCWLGTAEVVGWGEDYEVGHPSTQLLPMETLWAFATNGSGQRVTAAIFQ